MTATDRLVEEVVVAWVRWSQAPGSEGLAKACGAACRALAGDGATELREHVTGYLRDLGGGATDRDIRTAVTGWLGQQATTQGAVA